jgi:hypothetical protein
MQFDFNGQKYRFGFRYQKKEVTREIEIGRKGEVWLATGATKVTALNAEGPVILGIEIDQPRGGERLAQLRRGPNEQISITRTKTTWETVCRLMQLDLVTGKWNERMIHKATSSVDDQFSRNKGRSIALGRFKHDNPGKDGELIGAEGHGTEQFYAAMMGAWNARFQQRGKGTGAKSGASQV